MALSDAFLSLSRGDLSAERLASDPKLIFTDHHEVARLVRRNRVVLISVLLGNMGVHPFDRVRKCVPAVFLDC